MKSYLLIQLLVIILTILIIDSCKKDDGEVENINFKEGILIANEGPFQSGTGTITYFNPYNKTVKQDVFEVVNGRPLGNVVQSICKFNDTGYIVVNNSAKIEIVDMKSFQSLGTITGVVSPRYFQGINQNKAYVSDWSNVIDIIDLPTKSVTGTIATRTGPELMLKSGSNIFVLNSGAWGLDSTITVIDHTTDKVVKTIDVFHRPTGIIEDADGAIWVLCSGKGFNGYPAVDDTKGHLLRIDPISFAIRQDIVFSESGKHPEKLVVNGSGTTVYFLYDDGIFKFNVSEAESLPIKVVSHPRLYNLTYDLANDYIYASDRMDYQQNGWVIRYNAGNGFAMDSIQAGIIPGCILLNQ